GGGRGGGGRATRVRHPGGGAVMRVSGRRGAGAPPSGTRGPEEMAARGTGARLGALVHAALARAELGDPRAAASAVAAAAATLGESGARVTRARRPGEQAPAAPPHRPAASATRVLREVPVTAVVDGQLVEGVVDLAYQTVDGLAVVEVKLGPADAAAHAQVRAYCRALAVAGQPIAEACLLVVGPDGAEAIRVALPS